MIVLRLRGIVREATVAARRRVRVVLAASFVLLVVACTGQTDQVSEPTTDGQDVTETTAADQEGAAVWLRVAHDEAVFGGDGNQQMLSVAVGESGWVAVGFDDSGGDFDAAVWTSSDGVVWSRVAHDEAVFGGGDQQMLSVAVGESGWVAVGVDGSGGDFDAAVWTSSDGVAWRRVAHDEAVFGDPDGFKEMSSVAVGESGWVAVGFDDSDAAVWVTARED